MPHERVIPRPARPVGECLLPEHRALADTIAGQLASLPADVRRYILQTMSDKGPPAVLAARNGRGRG